MAEFLKFGLGSIPPVGCGVVALAGEGCRGRREAFLKKSGKGSVDGSARGVVGRRGVRDRVADGCELGFEEGEVAGSLGDRG